MNNNIFSNFYTKVLTFFQKDRETQGESAKATAQNRLKLVLMQDRSNLDGAAMQKMREQLIEVISKYIEIDQEALDLNLEADGEEIALMLNIPVIKARTREEIDALEAQEAEEKQKEIDEAVAAALAKDEEESEGEDETEETDKTEEAEEHSSEEQEVEVEVEVEVEADSEAEVEENCDEKENQEDSQEEKVSSKKKK